MSHPQAFLHPARSTPMTLPEIAALLSRAAEALLALDQPAAPVTAVSPDEPEPAPALETEDEPDGEDQDTIRCFRFSPFALRCERDLLEAEGARNFRDLLFNASAALSVFTGLLAIIQP